MKLIVVVDMQNEFLNWQDPIEANRITRDGRKYLEEQVKDPDTLIIFTRDTHHEESYKKFMESTLYELHCAYGTSGWELANVFREFAAEHNCDIIDKSTYVVDWYELSYTVAKFCLTRAHVFDEIEVFGLCKDICVLANLIYMNANYPTAKVSCIDNLCLATSPEGDSAADVIMAKMGFTHKTVEVPKD